MITAEQLKDVVERTEALHRYLAIDEKLIQVEEEQLRTQAPGFWDDAKAAEAQMKKVKDLQKWIDGYKEIKSATDDLEVAFDFFKATFSARLRRRSCSRICLYSKGITLMKSSTEWPQSSSSVRARFEPV